MIVALDSNGFIFYSLLQTNNNSTVMGMFVRQLVKKLNTERPGWRKTHVIMHDNAPYFKSRETLQLLEEL